jgi:hypothetical protein
MGGAGVKLSCSPLASASTTPLYYGTCCHACRLQKQGKFYAPLQTYPFSQTNLLKSSGSALNGLVLKFILIAKSICA